MKHIILFLFISQSIIFGQWQWHNIEYDNYDMDYLYDFFFMDSLRGIAVGDGWSPLITYNGGIDWFYPQGLNDLVRGELYFINKNVGFSYSYTIHKTTDFGESWKKVAPAGFHNFSDMHFINDSTGYIVGRDGEIFITRDMGENWTDISFEPNDELYYFSVYFSDPLNGWIHGNEAYKGEFILRTTDGGNSWKKNYINGINESIVIHKHFVDPLTGYGIYMFRSLIVKTSDGGETWIKCNMPQDYNKISSLFFLNESVGYAGGMTAKEGYGYGIIYKTVDGCKTWTKIYDTDVSSNIQHIFFVNENHGWASTGYGILRTTNGGTTFIQEKESTELSTSLISNYPNPFNANTTIRYTIREAGMVKINLYDILGREIKQIVNEYKSAGNYNVSLNSGDLSSGTYYYSLNTGDFVQYKSMVLLK